MPTESHSRGTSPPGRPRQTPKSTPGVLRSLFHQVLSHMRSRLALLRAVSLPAITLLATASAHSQCYTVTGNSIASQMTPTGTLPADDEGLSPDIAFGGFAFTIGGATHTHFVVDSNGIVYLTDGTGVVNRPTGGITSLADLRGGAGGSPRATPFSGDFEAVPGNWDILIDDSVSNEVKITWTGLRYTNGAGNFGMSVRLTANGWLWFDYSQADFDAPTSANFVGISGGNNVGTATALPLDLSQVNVTGSLALIYQNTWPPFDLPGTGLRFVRIGSGGYVGNQVCGQAGHESIGTACFPTGSLHQVFSDAAVASAELTGNGLLLTPSSNAVGYEAIWLPQIAAGLFAPPTAAATTLATQDDGEVSYPLSSSLTTPFGTFNDLTVHGNGIIAFGSGPVSAGQQNWVPTQSAFAAGAHGGVYCWHNYNETEGGNVLAEQPPGFVHVTFDNVENFPGQSSNPSTWQVQFNKVTGEIWMLFVSIDDDNTPILGFYPQDHLIGYTPPGAALATNPVNLATDLPYSLRQDLPALELAPLGLLTSTSSAGSTATYNIINAPEFVAGSATAAGLLIISGSTIPGGLELGVLGAPDCYSYVGDLAVTQSFVGAPGTQPMPVTVPPGVLPGTVIYLQAAALVSDFNDLGVMTSNAIKTTIASN